MTAESVIELLGLLPHPEGGAFRETYRSPHLTSDRHRSLASLIYFLLKSGERSRWHRVSSDEIWLFHGGDPLVLRQVDPAGALSEMTLGIDLASGQLPQCLVPRNNWQSAEPLSRGDHGWTLVSCVVAPGFDFEDFEMIGDDEMQSRFPDAKL